MPDDETPREDTPASASETKERKPYSSLPHVPRVFGKYGFLICVVPYLVYTAGAQLSGYLDSGRAHHVVQGQRGLVGNLIETAAQQAELATPTLEVRNAVQDLRLKDLLFEIREPEQMDRAKIDSLMQRFLDPKGPISAAARETVKEELAYMYELYEAEEKKHYRDVLEHDYQRQLVRNPDSVVARSGRDWFPAGRTYYPTLYAIAVGLSCIAVILALPGYLRTPWNFQWSAVIVGVVGIFVWILLWKLQAWFFQFDIRAAFNPLEELKDNPSWQRNFLVIRFLGLALIAPIVEEFFLRGFLIRFCDDPDWDEIQLGAVGKWGWVGVLVYAIFSHPGEALASVAWFSMVTWLYIRTGSIWNCVIAHMITNLLLGIYVLTFHEWALW